MTTILYAIGLLISALIIALMAFDIKRDLRISSEIKALPKGAKMTHEQSEWLAKIKSFDL